MSRYPVLIMVVLAVGVSPFAMAEPLTQEQGDAILQELRTIRTLLERQTKPPTAPVEERLKVDIDGAPSLGRPDAPLVLVEFVDYQCPFCKRFDTQTFPALKKQFIDTGKLRFVVLDLPLNFHPNAARAAEAARCAQDQGRFWEMREKLNAHSDKLGPESLAGYGDAIVPDPAAFKVCLDSGRHQAAIKRTTDLARSLNVSGTPTFVLGRLRDNVVEGVKLVGAQPLAAFESKIQGLSRAGGMDR